MNSKIEELKSLRDQCSQQIYDLEQQVKEAAEKMFFESGGCNVCRGRGWVVKWDTLDCMRGSYHQAGKCTEEGCTEETRAASGLLPNNNKYDVFHDRSKWRPSYTSDQMIFKETVEKKIVELEKEIRKEENLLVVTAGKIVRVSKKGKGPKARRVPVGIEGLVKKLHTNNWGSTKAIVVDSEGKKWWPALYQVEVIDPNPDMSVWIELDMKQREEEGFPIVVTVKKKTGRAVLVKTTTSKEIWIPFSQVPELERSKKRETLSVSVPMWIAEKNGLVTRG